MSRLSRLSLALKAASQLGPGPVGLYALYRLALLTGWYRRMERPPLPVAGELRPLFRLPARERLAAVLGESGRARLLAEADRSLNTTLLNTALLNTEHWSNYESGRSPLPESLFSGLPARDIKFVWEPARFGRAFLFGRAYHLTGEEKYAAAFWRDFEAFQRANPPFCGPHWMSAQEVALRLMAFVWAGQVFAPAACSTPERRAALAQAVAAHAQRIPPTLIYARAQGNNHLLSEAVGLYTAALALPGHPQAGRWRALGSLWLRRGFRAQIAADGTYTQHSVNYHRLMLHLALWVHALTGDSLLPQGKLSDAVQWLLALTDPQSGEAANLGANDGANILPLASCAFADQRPVLQAARIAFQKAHPFEAGPWDELSLWLDLPLSADRVAFLDAVMQFKRGAGLYPVLSAPRGFSWVYLRATRYRSRPSHADPLHLDLWWLGLNVAPDPGTYLYNAPAPWDNSLTAARYHNTVTVDDREPFTRAGRFLYLDWNRIRVAWTAGEEELSASYAPVPGVRHERSVRWSRDVWQVRDVLTPSDRRAHTFRLHWLLPDWPYALEESKLILDSGLGPLAIEITVEADGGTPTLSLARAGQPLAGPGPDDPRRGWVSPFYGLRLPALSCALALTSPGRVVFTTRFVLPHRLWRQGGTGA